ncbi:PREDICTED: uncharacterized protein LOC109191692 [Ipomoea nil]|uniref:uncharacterized protein LOC109191692 n=1 Tax=Ipomoea nil TaxID=35883 RepID=UPI0009012E8A|nr:PREDICTED: uncharacterized protein LOC109191692 [Ipomoea nil]
MPVSDSLKGSEEEKKPSDGSYRSASTKKRSNSGETSKNCKRECSLSEKAARKQAEKLVGRRIKVWWTFEQTFYEGSITYFDYFKKKHEVIYNDGDVEVLNLSKERWELIGDGAELPVVKREVEQRMVSRSNSAPSTSERAARKQAEKLVGRRIKVWCRLTRVCVSRFYRGSITYFDYFKKKHKVIYDDGDVEVLNLSKEHWKLIRDGAELPVVKREVEQRKVCRSNSAPSTSESVRDAAAELPVGEDGEKQKNKIRRFSVFDSEKMKTEVSDTAAAAHLEVSWLKQILNDIPTENDGQLARVIRNTALVSKAARKDLTQRKAELVIAERSYEEAKRQLERAEQSKRTAERAVEVLESVKKTAQNDMELNFKRNDLQNRPSRASE